MQDLQVATSVRTLRTNAGWSQQALATKAGLSTRTVARIEAGEDCTLGTLASIADAFELAVLDLLGDQPAEAAS